MKVFLTGATGFIGKPLTKILLGRGWDVTTVVRAPNSPRAQALSKIGARLAEGDVTRRESMRAAMIDADIVVHNAGTYDYGMNKKGKQRMVAVNVTGTDNVLELARESWCPRVRFIYPRYRRLGVLAASHAMKPSHARPPAAPPTNKRKQTPTRLQPNISIKDCP